jgi:amino acid adenylation domain-containing protein/FkbM family methyltransferase
MARRCTHEWFEDQVRQTPDAVAVRFEETVLTYRELNRRANQLAHHLRRVGVRPDARVALCLDRGVNIVIALLAVLKAGGAYVPLDPGYPAERLHDMLQDSRPIAVLTTGLTVREAGTPIIDVIAQKAAWSSCPESDLDVETIGLRPEHLAYVIYTSGSTGKPKGVMIEHRSLMNYTAGVVSRCVLGGGLQFANVSTFAADLGHTVIFPALVTGGCLHVLSQPRVTDPDAFTAYITERGIDVLKIVPSHFAALHSGTDLTRALPRLRLILGGEASRADWVRRLAQMAPACDIYNHYGPTETTVGVLVSKVSDYPHAATSTIVPLGGPLTDTTIYVLDPQQRPIPVGSAGELCIAGAGVARGYLDEPSLTAEKFVPNPFATDPGARMYRTGDRVSCLKRGALEFQGRTDTQVKIRGYRVELGEIEAALRCHPAVREAVVVAYDDHQDQTQLAAYVTTVRSSQPLWHSHSYRLPNGLTVAHLNKNETDYLYREIFVSRAYLRHGIVIGDGACVVDVGANIGLFTLFASQQAREVRIYACEPNPSAFQCLHDNVEAWVAGATCLPFGVADANERAEMTVFEGFSLFSGFYANARVEREVVQRYLHNQQVDAIDSLAEVIDRRFRATRISVPLRPLSDLIVEQRIDAIDLLKVNVEKSELDVLRGIRPDHWSKIHQLVIEVDQQASVAPLRALLERQGYEIHCEQDPLLRGTDLSYVYARRPSSAPAAASSASSAKVDRDAVVTPLILSEHLRESLPAHMVPAVYVHLATLPLTANGKLDRARLPAAERGLRGIPSYEAPQGDAETLLANVWADVLKVERVGRYDNFFQLGGHSLLAMTLVARMRRMGFAVDLPTMFEAPTIAELVTAARRVRDAVVVPPNLIPQMPARTPRRVSAQEIEIRL